MISQRPPGSEARAGRFPGPSLIPDLHAIQREHGWLPREELVSLSRDWRLEKTMRLTSTCGLGQVAVGPAISVLGVKRGATETRPQPRPPRPPDRTTPGDAGPEASVGGANAGSDGAAASDADSS